MATKIKTRTAKTTGFTDRVRFNWGYHDAAADAGRGQARWTIETGEQTPRRVSRQFDVAYHDGYVAGLAAAHNGVYQGDSTQAWAERRRTA